MKRDTKIHQFTKRIAGWMAVLFLMFCFLSVCAPVQADAADPAPTATKKTLYTLGGTYQIQLNKYVKEGAYVSYYSNNTKAVKVSKTGLVTPVAPGKAKVYVKIKQGGKVYKPYIIITVKKSYITVPNKETRLVQSSDFVLDGKAYGLPGAKLKYTSSNVMVAKVDPRSGLVHARNAGKTKIAITDTVSGMSAEFTLTIVEKTAENIGLIYVLPDTLDKNYVYKEPENYADLSVDAKARVDAMLEIQNRITLGQSITIQEMTEYIEEKNRNEE